MDDLDRELLVLLQRDASQPYATLGRAVGLSPGAAHERVRKLRERGVIRRTTIEVDPVALGRGILAFLMVRASAWMGDQRTRDALAALPEVQEAHVVAGSAALLLKVRTTSTASLQGVLRRIFKIDGVASTEAVVVLETFFERPTDPRSTGSTGSSREHQVQQEQADQRKQAVRAGRAEQGEEPGPVGRQAEQATADQRAR